MIRTRRRFPQGRLAGSRRAALVGGLALFALAGAGCKSVVHAGAAATVGNHRISTAALRKATDDLYQGPAALSFTRAQVQQYALNGILAQAVYDRAAADLRITPPPASVVDQTIAQLEVQLGGEAGLIQAAAQQQVLLSHATMHEFFARQLEQQALASELIKRTPPPESFLRAAYAANIATYQSESSSFILVKTQALAEQIKGQLAADPSRFAALAKQYSTDAATKDNGGNAGNQPRGTLDPTLEDAIFAAKDGAIIGPIKTQLGYYVVKVGTITDVPYAKARARLLQQVVSLQDPTYGQSLLSKELSQVAKSLDIHVNARFGSWSSATVSVGPDLSALSSTSSTSPAPTGTSGP